MRPLGSTFVAVGLLASTATALAAAPAPAPKSSPSQSPPAPSRAAPAAQASQSPAGPPAPPTPQPVAGPKLAMVAALPPAQTVEFDVILPLRNPTGLAALLAAQQNPASPQYHKWLQPNDFASQFGASQQTVNLVSAALTDLGLHVTPQSRSLHVAGTTAQVNAAFNISLALAMTPSGQSTVVAGKNLVLPPSLASVGAIVSAFSPTAYQAAPFIHRMASGYIHRMAGGYIHSSAWGYAQGADGTVPGYFYNDLKQAYSFPSYQTTIGKGKRLDGTGSTVAVIMASDVQDSDITTLFEQMGFRQNSGQQSDPALFARRLVNGGTAFSATNPAAEEATADVEQVLGGAPGAHVMLYNTPDLSDQSLISAYVAIVNDDVADVVSMSFGQCELNYTAAYNNGQDQTAVLKIFSELFEQGNAEGITFVAASGDASGAGCLSTSYFAGGGGKFVPGVSVPAADPNVTAVGGTNLVTAADLGGTNSAYTGENAWADPELPVDPYGIGTSAVGGLWGSGGGVSTIFAQPAYQSAVPTGSSTSRTLPDVAMQMGGCPDIAQLPCNGELLGLDGAGNTDRSSLNVIFNGQLDNVIGTSLAAPEFASVVALLVEAQGRQGNLNYPLYAMAQSQAAGGAAYFHNAVSGWNGLVSNSSVYNYTTGVGSPIVAAVIGLPQAALAGNPQSASNP